MTETDRKRPWAVLLLSMVYAFFYTMLTAEHFLSAEGTARFGISFCILLILLGQVSGLIGDGFLRKRKKREYRMGERRFFLLSWGIFSAVGLILWLSLFPGIFGYDSYKQMAFYTGAEAWSTHHPVFHTWLLGTMLSIGKSVFGSYSAGVALYTFLQMLFIESAFAYTLLFLRRRGVPAGGIAAAAVFFLIHPTIQLLNFNTTKDTLFGVCFLYFLLALLQIAGGDGRRRLSGLFFISGLFSCLLRNQGVYVMAVLFFLFLGMYLWQRFGMKKKEKVGHDPAKDREGLRRFVRLMAGIAVICAATKLFDLVCVGPLHIRKGEVREMLSVPMQQTAAILIADRRGEAVIDEKQRETAKTLITEEALDVYEPDTADPVKGLFPSAQFGAYAGTYLKNYLTMALANHGICTDAWLSMIRPYWDMSLSGYRGLMAEYTGDCEREFGIFERPLIPFAGRLLKALAIHDDYRLIPGISHLFDPGFYIWAAATVAVIALIYRKKAAGLACIPGLLYFCTLLLGPVALVRYLYPLLLSVPVIVGLLFEGTEEA